MGFHINGVNAEQAFIGMLREQLPESIRDRFSIVASYHIATDQKVAGFTFKGVTYTTPLDRSSLLDFDMDCVVPEPFIAILCTVA